MAGQTRESAQRTAVCLGWEMTIFFSSLGSTRGNRGPTDESRAKGAMLALFSKNYVFKKKG